MFDNTFAGKKILVTGHTGFKGSWMCTWLHHLGAQVVGVADRVPTQPSMFEALGLASKIKHVVADIRDAEAMARIVAEEQPEFFFHMAAQAIVSESYANPLATLATNIMGTAHLLDALRRSGHTCTAVFITSDKCYENVEWTWGYRENDRLGGKDPYSASKAGSELAIYTYFHSFFAKENSNLRLVSVRAGNVIGGGDWAANRIVPDCVRAWSQGQPVEIRRPKATRPWQHVLEPISGYLRAAQVLHQQRHLSGESYNFGPAADQSATVQELLEEVAANWGFEPGQEKFKIDQQPTFHEAGLLKLNCDKALHDLGWKPVLKFQDAAAFSARWYHTYYYRTGDIYDLTLAQIADYSQRAQSIGQPWARA